MPSDRNQLRWLNDILDNILLAESFTDRLSYEAFAQDRLRLYATIRCLEIISEASRRLSETIKQRHPVIDWQEVAAAGNVYRHEYKAIATRRVWSTLKDSLPPLRTIVEREIRDDTVGPVALKPE